MIILIRSIKKQLVSEKYIKINIKMKNNSHWIFMSNFILYIFLKLCMLDLDIFFNINLLKILPQKLKSYKA
jgi:hypothetical protein